MSQNIEQIFVSNPIITNATTDLMYFGQSPYGASDDAAMTFGNFSAQFTLAGGAVNTVDGDSGSATSSGGVITISGGATGLTTVGASHTLSMTGTLAIDHGGTGVTSVTTAPAATAFAGWDANSNMSANNFIRGYATIATAAGTTTLTVASAGTQRFTGITTQTLILPVASTLTLGFQFIVTNDSTGVVTVQSSGANTILAMAGNTNAIFTCILTSGTSAASWTYAYSTSAGSSGTVTSGTINDLAYYATTGTTVSGLATANSASLVTDGSGAPAWQTLTAGQILVGTTSGAPAATAINSGTGIIVSNSSGSITVSATGGGLATATISGTTQTAVVSTKYIALNAGQTTLTLPATYAVGDIVSLIGSTANTGGWIVAAAPGDTIRVNNATTSAGGTVTCTADAGQCIVLVCDVANVSWVMFSTVSVLLTTA